MTSPSQWYLLHNQRALPCVVYLDNKERYQASWDTFEQVSYRKVGAELYPR